MTTTQNAVDKVKAQAAATKTTDISKLIQQSVKELGKALPSHMSAERLVRIALTTLRLNPDLYKCTPESFLGALFQSAQLGLEPNVEGQAYILPFNNRRKINNEWTTIKEAQFQIGFKGYAELFYRHEKSLSLDMQIVREKDDFDYAYGTEAFLRHKPADGDRGEVKGYYAIAKLANGATLFHYMSKSDAMEHGKKFSKTWISEEYDYKLKKKVKLENPHFAESSPWSTNPDAMCMKTVLIRLMKLLPKSIEIQRALAMDETIKTRVDKDMFAVPDATDWTQEAPIEAEITKAEGVLEPGDDQPSTLAQHKLLDDLSKKIGDEKTFEILTSFKAEKWGDLNIGQAKQVAEKMSKEAFKK